jgi:CTP synthase
MRPSDLFYILSHAYVYLHFTIFFPPPPLTPSLLLGITISSIGRLLKQSGLRVTSIKIDPYLNTDAGTMSPFEHGEVFVLNDGGEVDLDLGNYERFLSLTLSKDHNITTGKVYNEVILRERRGDYLGKTVQVVPHVTDEIQNWIERVALLPVDGSEEPPDVCLVEVGGTVGDIESSVFLEALRQFQFRVGRENFCLLFVSLVPVLGSVGEQKTKPTQHGVKELRAVGLSPDVIICRSSNRVELSTREKISVFCHCPPSHVLSVHDVSNIYHVPIILAEQNLHGLLREHLRLDSCMTPEPDLERWTELATSVDVFTEEVKIAIVGKYTGLSDSYLSVLKALKHASIAGKRALEICWVEASDLEEETEKGDKEKWEAAWKVIEEVDGIVVPGGFGTRGVEGKILTVEYARKRGKPILGVCLGMQVMVIEHCRNVLGMAGVTSEEFAAKAEEVGQKEQQQGQQQQHAVVFMPEINQAVMGGTMRLGARPTHVMLKDAKEALTLAGQLYKGSEEVWERHRHRYEVNPDLVRSLEKAGLHFVGKDETGTRMEIVELDREVHPFFFGTQYHPEFQSRPLEPSPPFLGLILAASRQLAGFLKMVGAN